MKHSLAAAQAQVPITSTRYEMLRMSGADAAEKSQDFPIQAAISELPRANQAA